MKNLIVNIFKTLFFFDLAVIVLHFWHPKVTASNAALLMLKQEALILAVPLSLTLIFFLLVERCRVGVPFNKRVFRSFLWGLGFGIVPIGVLIGTLKVFKLIKFSVFNRPAHIWIWIGALFLKVLAVELLYRGYLFRLYKKYHGTMFAVIATTALYIVQNYEILSANKIYRANIILFNILLCLILDRYGSVIVTVLARFIYTLISCMLFGSLYSSEGYPVIFKVVVSGKAIYNGGEYLLEGSVITLVILSLLSAVLIVTKYRIIKNLKMFFKSIKPKIKLISAKIKRKKKQA